MAPGQTTRRRYSAEELHRLRNAYSLPKLEEAIEERDGEDAEVVKGSSASPRALAQNNLAVNTPRSLHIAAWTGILIFAWLVYWSSIYLAVTMTICISESVALNLKWIDELIATPPEERTVSDNTDASPTEHVLRGSKSFTARSFRSRTSARSLRVPSATPNDENAPLSAVAANRQLQAELSQPSETVLGEIAGNSQTIRPVMYKFGPSPTPSMKKKKAEAIVKAHGSPTHIRVTAGGRIVPSEQSPLCHPRYGYSAVKVNGGLIKFAPNYHAGKAQWTRATEDGFVAQDIHGNLCQIVNGMVLPLNQIDGALRLYIPAPNLKVTQRGSNQGPFSAYTSQHDGRQPSGSEIECALPLEPSIPSQIGALELEYAKLEHDLKDVDKTEVIHGRTMSKGGKDALVTRRRELVISMDKVRKALKALKSQPPPNAPTSPRALARVHNASSPIPRHPAFSSVQSVGESMKPHQHVYGPYAGVPPPTLYNANFAFHPMPPLGELYSGQPWAYGNPSMFVPPPCDGSFGAHPPTYQDQDLVSAFQQMSMSEPMNGDVSVPQNDGSSSQVEPQTRSPCRSHAVPIKAPDIRSTGQKSTLNPMSPAYKPAPGARTSNHGSAEGSINSTSSKRSCGPPTVPLMEEDMDRAQAAAGDRGSTTKREIHLQSSSISSFETADFFPRNTIEYSTRLRSPSYRHGSLDDKENKDPESSISVRGTRPITPHQEALGEEWRKPREDRIFKEHSPNPEHSQPPAPPPGTPVHPSETASKPSTSIEIDHALWYRKSKVAEQNDIISRGDHNISPKIKRGLVAEEKTAQGARFSSNSSLESVSLDHKDIHARAYSNLIDFTQKPREWIEGYQAGLRRQPVGGDRYGEFLDGYCEGLLKSKPINSGPSPNEHSTGSPTKSAIRRPTPVLVPWPSVQQQADQISNSNRNAGADLNNVAELKQAVIAPQNEDAILTPSIEGRHVSEYPFNLGAWARSRSSPRDDDTEAHATRFFSGTEATHAAKPIPSKRRITSDGGKYSSSHAEAGHPDPMPDSSDHLRDQCATQAPEHTNGRIAPSASHALEENATPSENTSNHVTRVDSVIGIDSTLHRPWPGHRVFSPHSDINPTPSISRAASVAAGFLAHTQFEGAPHGNRITSTASTTVVPTNAHGRFHERPFNRVMSSPSTPPVTSTSSSPKRTPANESPRRKLVSQSKTSSPAKSTFDNLAGKVGIKVSPNVKIHADEGTTTGADGASPSGKRRWRDVWRGGARKDDNH